MQYMHVVFVESVVDIRFLNLRKSIKSFVLIFQIKCVLIVMTVMLTAVQLFNYCY